MKASGCLLSSLVWANDDPAPAKYTSLRVIRDIGVLVFFFRDELGMRESQAISFVSYFVAIVYCALPDFFFVNVIFLITQIHSLSESNIIKSKPSPLV